MYINITLFIDDTLKGAQYFSFATTSFNEVNVTKVLPLMTYLYTYM